MFTVDIPEHERSRFEKELWNDLCSEHDSEYFYQRVLKSNRNYSKSFRDFLETWRIDEKNHAEGFLEFYRLCFEKDPSAELQARVPEFDRLDCFFEDEFSLCVLLAYDELVTTLAYHQDLEFYERIGCKDLRSFLEKVIADEARHFYRILEVIRFEHREQLNRAAMVIDKILALDLSKKSYDATFVLDHSEDSFSKELLKDCAKRVLRKLELMKCHST